MYFNYYIITYYKLYRFHPTNSHTKKSQKQPSRSAHKKRCSENMQVFCAKICKFCVFIHMHPYIVKTSSSRCSKFKNKSYLHSCCHMISKFRTYTEVLFETQCETSTFPRHLKYFFIQWFRHSPSI